MISKLPGKTTTLTEGPVWRGIVSFALPVLIGNIFQQLYNSIDSLIAGNFIGDAALASVSSSGSLIYLLIGFFNGMAMGAGILIGRYFGAKQYDQMRRIIYTDIALGLLISVFLAVVGVFLTPLILRWMHTPDSIINGSILYFRIYFAGCISMIMFNVLQGILHAVGDSRHPLHYLAAASILNVGLDLLFSAVLHLGVGGLAFATVLSQGLSAALCLRRLMRTQEVYRIRLREIRIHRSLLRQIVRIGLPSGVQNSVIALANIVVQSSINLFDQDAIAGCGAYAKIEGFVVLPITCFAMSMTTFISQNLGAAQYDRAKKGAKFGIICSMVLAQAVGLLVYWLIPVLISWFNSKPNVMMYGIMQARIETLFFCFLAFSHCVAGILRGAGKTNVPMVIMLAVWCILRVTYITVILRYIPQINVIFWAYPLTWGISSVIFLIYYLRADWPHAYEKKKLSSERR